MGEFKICTTPTDDVNGKKKVCITQKQCNDTVTAVFVDAVLEATESNYLDSECGVIVSLSLNKNTKQSRRIWIYGHIEH